MGGIYAREEGLPEEVWKAIYFHYLPVGVEADAPPSRAQLGSAAVDLGGRVARRQARHRSSACSPPARSRPARAIRTACAARRTASFEILVDLPELTGIDARPTLGELLRSRARAIGTLAGSSRGAARTPRARQFLVERLQHLLERAGLRPARTSARSCTRVDAAAAARRRGASVEALPRVRRRRRSSRRWRRRSSGSRTSRSELERPTADRAGRARVAIAARAGRDGLLAQRSNGAGRRSRGRSASGDYRDGDASSSASSGPAVDRFFDDVLVMADDPRPARRRGCALLTRLARRRASDIARHLGDLAAEDGAQA